MPFTPLLGQIVPFACNFAPRGWAFCAGQILSISQNTALFSILGTTYGGNGTTNFALPDLRGRVAIHFGLGAGLSPYSLGETGGSESVTLLASNLPAHSHAAVGTNNAANFTDPPGLGWAGDGAGVCTQFAPTPNAQMSAKALDPTGGGLPHNNLAPVLGLNYCIAMQGIFPARN
jgi:microcystin-dependent protein